MELVKAYYYKDSEGKIAYSRIDNSSNTLYKLSTMESNLDKLQENIDYISNALSQGRVEFYYGSKPENIEKNVLYVKVTDIELKTDNIITTLDPDTGDLKAKVRILFYNSAGEDITDELLESKVLQKLSIKWTGYVNQRPITDTYLLTNIKTKEDLYLYFSNLDNFEGVHPFTVGSQFRVEFELVSSDLNLLKSDDRNYNVVSLPNLLELGSPSVGFIKNISNETVGLRFTAKVHLLSDKVNTKLGVLSKEYINDSKLSTYEPPQTCYFIIYNPITNTKLKSFLAVNIDQDSAYNRTEGREWSVTITDEDFYNLNLISDSNTRYRVDFVNISNGNTLISSTEFIYIIRII